MRQQNAFTEESKKLVIFILINYSFSLNNI